MESYGNIKIRIYKEGPGPNAGCNMKTEANAEGTDYKGMMPRDIPKVQCSTQRGEFMLHIRPAMMETVREREREMSRIQREARDVGYGCGALILFVGFS